ncbi:MAG: hypothetical protein A2Y09_05685 [Planctomycetes bacterium GWA2_39_15]|nr:MAG: hypothetical protein A2Y09_05685 [Planctomycetes bacterium GWA2_39_15]
MLRCILSFLVALAAIFLAKPVIADSKDTLSAISWEKTFDDAVTKAKAAGKPILLDFFVPT